MNALKIKVDIWSDFPCPFCLIGKRRFENALNKFEHKDKVETVFRSFQLDPHAPKDPKHDIYSRLSAKYGMSLERARATVDGITKQAKELGLQFNLGTSIFTNTYDAHRLAHFAKEKGKADELIELIMKAYFTDSKHIGDHETLTQLATQIGLDEKETRAVLTGEKYSEEMKRDLKQAAELDINGVPFFLFNNKYAVSGAQPEEVFIQVLEKIWKEEGQNSGNAKNAKQEDKSRDNICADGTCKL